MTTLNHWALGDLTLARLSAGVPRGPTHSGLPQVPDSLVLIHAPAVPLRLELDAQRLDILTGEFVLIDPTRPHAIAAVAVADTVVDTPIVLTIPLDRLADVMHTSDDLHGLVLRGHSTLLLARHLDALAGHVARLTADETAALARSLLHLLAVALLPTLSCGRAEPTDGDAALLRKATQFVDERLADDTLCVEDIRAHMNVSRATLYRLFHTQGGVSRFIKERRLLRAKALVDTGTADLALASLAERVGFSGGVSLSASFRERFGCTVRDALRARTRSPHRSSATRLN